MEMTQNQIIASKMAIRNFQEDTLPIINSLTSDDAKQGYTEGLFVAVCATLSQIVGDDFEKALYELVVSAKQANQLT
ncbi:hypothetical protein VH441_07285 [Psychrobacter sp. HD31]|uniref:hypothetical protein n=1 Tax=Psychrobacter sp. HD31 TaxID=3112003 RepID=UPI003DA25D13